jgi:hypothetical protein
MKNINTIINRVKKENDKNKNFIDRLIRKKTDNDTEVDTGRNSGKESKIQLNAEEILEITLQKQKAYKEKLAEDQQEFIKNNNLVHLSTYETGLKNLQELHSKKLQELKNILEKKEKIEEDLRKQLETQLKKREEITKRFELQMQTVGREKDFSMFNLNSVSSNKNKQTNINEQMRLDVKLVNVYQPIFAYNRKATGWGDILRGCYFLIQFCEEHELEYDIDMSFHPISKFLKKYRNLQCTDSSESLLNDKEWNNELKEMKKNIYNNIVIFEENNFFPKITAKKVILSSHKSSTEVKTRFTKYLNSIPYYYDNMDINDNSDEKVLKKKYIHTITFPMYNTTYLQKERMKEEVEPCEELKMEVQTHMDRLQLVKGRYVILHIRCGDTYLLENNRFFSKMFILNVIKEIKQWLNFLVLNGNIINMNNNKEEDRLKTSIFCISDTNDIKRMILKELPFIKTLFFDIKHTGEGQQLDDENVKNTIKEFYMMSMAKSIFCLSSYNHGSGFSKWCAETYSIPYMCKYVPNSFQ